MSDLISRAKELLEGVTPGPWEPSEDGDEITVGAGSYLEHPGSYTSTDLILENDVYGDDDPDRDQRARDARFIAAARELVPELVSELERLQAKQATPAPTAKATAART